ncbi:hypothetical protein ACP70R_024507 [Stipagrostis hirtigluma subsp. patula]
MAPPATQAVTAATTSNADLCYSHYKDFKDCFNSNETKLGKCENHLHLLYLCHWRARTRADAVMGPPTNQVAVAPPMGTADSCDIHSKDFEDCLNNYKLPFGKCENHLQLLYQCRQKNNAALGQTIKDVAVCPMDNADSCHNKPELS